MITTSNFINKSHYINIKNRDKTNKLVSVYFCIKIEGTDGRGLGLSKSGYNPTYHPALKRVREFLLKVRYSLSP